MRGLATVLVLTLAGVTADRVAASCEGVPAIAARLGAAELLALRS